MQEALDLPDIDATAIGGPGTSVVTFEQFAVAPLEAIRAGLVALANRYDRVAFDLTTPAGLAAAKEARHDLRENGRYAVQRAGEKFKKDANAAKKKADALVIELAAIVEPVEDRLDKIIKAREAEIAAEKEREEARKRAHREAIERINRLADGARGRSVADLDKAITVAENISTGPEWEEFAPQALTAKESLLSALRAERAVAQAREEEAARVEAQRLENERRAAELREREQALAAERRQAEATARFAAALQGAITRVGAVAVAEALPDVGDRTANFTVEELNQHAATLEALQPQIKPNAEESGSSPADAPATGTPVSYASSEPQAAQGSPSGDEGTGAHAEERAPEPANGGVWREVGPTAFGFGTIIERVDTPAPAAPTLNLGTIQKRLGFTIGADFLATLGFTGKRDRSAMLYQEAQFKEMCAKLAEHILTVGEAHATKEA